MYGRISSAVAAMASRSIGCVASAALAVSVRGACIDINLAIGKVTDARRGVLRALANERRLQILDWLKDPRAHFRGQVDGDLVEDGVCGVLIAEKLGVSAADRQRASEVLAQAGLVRAKRIKQWTFYRRDEAASARSRRP